MVSLDLQLLHIAFVCTVQLIASTTSIQSEWIKTDYPENSHSLILKGGLPLMHLRLQNNLTTTDPSQVHMQLNVLLNVSLL